MVKTFLEACFCKCYSMCAFDFFCLERTWTANSKKDPETLSQLLNNTAEKPRTPYEQKRVQEIKKLNKTVSV